MVSGETINSFLARVRAQFDSIRSISGGGVFQLDFSSTPGLTSVYDKKLEEKLLCMFVMYRSDRSVFGERLKVFANCRMRMEMITIRRNQANC